MKALAVMLASLSLAFVGCGTTDGQSTNTGGAKIVYGHGLRVSLPSGWTGRVFQRSPKDAITLEAATTQLPARDPFLTEGQLGIENARES